MRGRVLQGERHGFAIHPCVALGCLLAAFQAKLVATSRGRDRHGEGAIAARKRLRASSICENLRNLWMIPFLPLTPIRHQEYNLGRSPLLGNREEQR